MRFIYFLKSRSDAVHALRRFLADSSPFEKLKRMRSDNAKEYVSEEFAEILLQHEVKFETSAPYCPHQNGTAERGFFVRFLKWLDVY